MRSICSPYVGKGKLRSFLRNPLQKPGELLNLSRNQLRILTGPLTGHFCLKGGLFCDRCKQASEMVSDVLCDCESLATLRYRNLGCNFVKPSDFEDISVSKILHFAQGAGLLND